MTNNPDVRFKEVSRIVGEAWQKMSDSEKKQYNDKAKEVNAKALQEANVEGFDSKVFIDYTKINSDFSTIFFIAPRFQFFIK